MDATEIARTGVVHVHSHYSHDGVDALDMLREFAHRRGIGFIGLTDHAEDFDSAIFQDYQEECHALSDDRVTLIPGLEFRFAGFPGLHLLALGLQRFIQPETPADFCQAAGTHAAFTIVAHPVLPRYLIPEEVSRAIHAIEVWNAAYNTRFLPDMKAVRLYQRLRRGRPDLVAVAGLDQHDSRNDRETRVVLDQPSTTPLEELRLGRFRNRGRTLEFDSHAGWGPASMLALTGCRFALDLTNQAHEWVMRHRKMVVRGRR